MLCCACLVHQKLRCSYESELARTTREKTNTEVQLHRSKTDSQLLQSELARAEERAKEFETKWREAVVEGKGYRRQLDENYAKVLQLEPENDRLNVSKKNWDSELYIWFLSYPVPVPIPVTCT